MNKNMTRESFIEITSDLGICGCGSPEEAYEAIHKLLLTLQAKNWDEWLKSIDNDIYALIVVYVLDGNGYLEHGTSIRHPWLTIKGEQLLEALDTLKVYGYDYDETFNLLSEDQ